MNATQRSVQPTGQPSNISKSSRQSFLLSDIKTGNSLPPLGFLGSVTKPPCIIYREQTNLGIPMRVDQTRIKRRSNGTPLYIVYTVSVPPAIFSHIDQAILLKPTHARHIARSGVSVANEYFSGWREEITAEQLIPVQKMAGVLYQEN